MMKLHNARMKVRISTKILAKSKPTHLFSEGDLTVGVSGAAVPLYVLAGSVSSIFTRFPKNNAVARPFFNQMNRIQCRS